MKAAIYARVSTSNGSQTCENQLLELRRVLGGRFGACSRLNENQELEGNANAKTRGASGRCATVLTCASSPMSCGGVRTRPGGRYAALAPKGNLARGRDAKHHSPHLFSGFAKCHTCGGAMTSVSGGAGSPRFGCRRSWNEGRNACPNRVTIRIKVAERLILEKLQSELREPANVTQIANAVAKTVRALMDLRPTSDATHQRRLEEERRKLANLIATIEAGGHAPASLLKAVSEREATIERLEAERPPSGRSAPSRRT